MTQFQLFESSFKPNLYGHLLIRFVLTAAVILIASSPYQSLNAQEGSQDEGQATEDSDDAPEVTNKVSVSPEARDIEIEQRLLRILYATNWFDNPEVQVDEGVVFLEGTTSKDDYRQWARDLAKNTQDVVAVVNRIKVKQKSIWDFSDANSEIRDFASSSLRATPLIVFGAAILLVAWLLAKVIGWAAGRILQKKISSSLLRWVVVRAIVLPIFIFAIYLVLKISGLTQLALTVLGGTGLVGLVIGIAFKDIAENFLASVLISIQKPFRIGDEVRIGQHHGIVDRVTTRGTVLMTFDGNHVQIPNSHVYKNIIENYTANPLRRISFTVGIGYDDPTSEAQSIVLEAINNHAATLAAPAPRVLIEVLAASTVNLRAYFWIDGTENDHLAVQSSCMRIAKQNLALAGISMPDESREVIFPQGVPVEMNHQDLSEQSANGEQDREKLTAQPPQRQSQLKPKADEDQRLVENQPLEKDFSEAEGSMVTEKGELQKQAENSWQPESGTELLRD